MDLKRHHGAPGALRTRSAGPVDLEWPSDAVAGNVFERLCRDKLIQARLPLRARREDPARLGLLYADLPSQRLPGLGRHPERALQQAVVEWGGEVHRERIPRPVDRNLQPPVGGIEGTLSGRPHPELAAERRDEGLPGGVAPVRIDHERVRPTRRKRAAQLLVREDAAL